MDLQNIITPRIGHELNFGAWIVRLGYAYKPSIFGSLPTGSGNYLDPPKHQANAGLGLQVDQLTSMKFPLRIDAHFSFHYLMVQNVVKNNTNENGEGTSALMVGAPSYQAGGKILGAGVSLSTAL
jgi:hypothetical protein